jgi:tripartite-type tricarboxylate transporter receptor subunit TctC
MSSRNSLSVALLTCVVLIQAGVAAAQAVSTGSGQAYPSRPIRFIVPYLPGGSADAFARMVAPLLSDAMGQPVIIDNRGGAGGTIGTEIGARAAPDGYTLVLATANVAVNASLYKQWSIDPARDLKAVSLLGSAPNVIAVNPSLPVANVKELIALAKAKPGQIRYASGGSGSSLHLAAELLKIMAGIDLMHVPYKATGPAVVAVLSGEVAVLIPPASVVLPHDKTGKLRAIAICSTKRFDAAPGLPTVAESGVPGYEASQWYGIVVPPQTPQAIVSRLNAEIVKIVKSPEFEARMLAQATVVSGTTPEVFARYLREEVVKWAKVVKASGMRVE